MPTADVPNLDSSLHLYDAHIPLSIARTGDVVSAALVGAANGVAPLDASAHLPATNMVANGIQCVHYNGVAWPASRPTDRTDVTVFIDAPAGTAPPAWKLATDRFETF